MTENKNDLILVKSVKEQDFLLDYYLTLRSHTFKTGNISFMCYGVKIVMKRAADGNFIEENTINNIFSSKTKALEFVYRLADENVMPCSLEDIVSDMLSEALRA